MLNGNWLNFRKANLNCSRKSQKRQNSKEPNDLRHVDFTRSYKDHLTTLFGFYARLEFGPIFTSAFRNWALCGLAKSYR